MIDARLLFVVIVGGGSFVDFLVYSQLFVSCSNRKETHICKYHSFLTLQCELLQHNNVPSTHTPHSISWQQQPIFQLYLC